ncbi:GIP [Symbiodinium sp. KB8]|nr:GIP [Symbiodinium sp. KB8]
MCPTPRLQLQHAGLYLLVDPLLADQQGPARSSQQPAEGDDETDDSEALTYDPTVSIEASSVPSRRAQRYDPYEPEPPRLREHRPGQAPPRLHQQAPDQVPERAQAQPLRDAGPRLPEGDLEHPAHMSLDDVRAAFSPKKKDSTASPSWNSRMGPEKHVRWRGGTPPSPPTWRYDVTDLRAFSKWARKVEIWTMQIKSYMTAREAALLLYNSLTGEAEAELEHAPLERINSDTGIQYILECLKAPMEQKAVYQKRKYLADFEQLNRYPGEGLRTFANRYRRVERSLEALGVSITGMYDAEARGNRLLERARLTQGDQRLILVGARYSLNFDDICDSMVMQYPEFKAAPPVVNKDGSLVGRTPQQPRENKGGKGQPTSSAGSGGKGFFHDRNRQPPRKVFVAEQAPDLENIPEEEADEHHATDQDAEDFHDIPPDQDPEDVDAEDFPDLGEVAEVLTVTAKKLSGLRLGRKLTGGPKKDTAALKRETHCQACGEKGHWKGDPECSMTAKPITSPSRPAPSSSSAPSSSTSAPGKGKGKDKRQPHQTFFMRDLGTYEAGDQQDFGNMFEVNVVFKVQDHPGDVGPDFSELMVLDTACQRTCCGKDWEKTFYDQLGKRGLRAYQAPCADAFQFGRGEPLKAARRAYMPMGIGGKNLLLGAGVVEAKVPLLASNKLLDQLGMVLDLPRNQVHFEKLRVSVPLRRIGGHLTVCITDFSTHATWDRLQAAVNWKDPPAELVARDLDIEAPGNATPHGSRLHLPSGASSVMASRLATVGGPPPRLQEAGFHEHGGRGEHGHSPGGDLCGDSPDPRRGLQPPDSTCDHPEYVRYGNAYGKFAKCKKCGFRHHTARLATAFALLFQYLLGGGPAEQQQSVPAFVPNFADRSYPQDFTQEAFGTQEFGEQRLGDGVGPLEDSASRGVRGLRLDRGRLKRLKGSWTRSARTLENERGIYDAAPTTSERPPPTVDTLLICEAWKTALRSIRRLRPHVPYVSYLDFFPDGNFGNNVRHLVDEQVSQGRAFVLVTRHGHDLTLWHDAFFGNKFETKDADLYTNIPGASGYFLRGRDQLQDHHGYHEPLATIPGMIRDYVSTKEPMKFGIYDTLVAYQTPVSDLKAWDEMAEMLHRSFGTSSSRPFYVDPAGEVGKKIADLFRMRLERIQCVQTPTQRRMPPDIPYTARAAFLMYADGGRAVEVEDLNLVQQPKQRFAKAVRYAILAYGDLLEDDAGPKPDSPPEVPVAGLPTDVSFPGLAPTVPMEVRRAIARAHVNLGHASPQELLRLAVQTGNPSDLFLQAIRKLRCSTCERLRGPQQPPPATIVARATQFGDRVEADIFYTRDLRGRSVIVLGVVDAATRLHQAAILPSREPEEAYEALERIWLRPFGLMTQIVVDPDGTFQGAFEERLRSHGVLVSYCAADAHWQIGQVERQNAFLRTVLEKMTETFAATDVDQMQLILAPSLHAVNSMVLTRGRSAYQAVFGRVPRLPGGLFTDGFALANTPTTDAAASAEIVRSEAIKAISELNTKQSLRRALLRKTRHVQVADLQPGQPCAYWRWRKRGIKKRGGWVTAKFLSWDPSSPGKLAWVRSGTSTAMVAIEQLRVATGFEAWVPTEEEVTMLKDAAKSLDQTLWSDDSGPPPPERQLQDEPVDVDLELFDTTTPELVAANVAAPPTPPPGPHVLQQQEQNLQMSQQNQTVVIQPNMRQTIIQQNTARLGDPAQGARRANSMPRTPRATSAPRTPRAALRSRSPKPPAAIAAAPGTDGPQEQQALPQVPPEPPVPRSSLGSEGHQEQQALPQVPPEPPVPVPPTPLEVGLESAQYESAAFSDIPGFDEETETPVPQSEPHESTDAPLHTDLAEPPVPQAPGERQTPSGSRAPTTPVTSSLSSNTGENLLPAKHPFDTLVTLFYEDGNLHRCSPADSLDQGFGPKPELFYQAYLSSRHRQDDVQGTTKEAAETDSSDSDWDDDATGRHTGRPLSRAEAKALDREIPWRKILEMDAASIEAFKKATLKEAQSWKDWGSVKELSHEEAQRVLKDKVLSRRILRTRSCFRDKSRGLTELIPKCRVVALGHKDPDIFRLNRECATPNRTSEHVLFCVMVAGHNKEFLDSGLSWKAWSGDASTAFLQGDISASERDQPLYLLPPTDGITAMTDCWKAPLYLVCTNIYGLSNAPRLWSLTVISRLKEVGYRQHSFDKMVFLKFDGNDLISVIIVYVDDFIGTYREDYDITEVTNAFRWGAFQEFEIGKTVTFKGKQLTLKTRPSGRIFLHVCQREFIEGMSPGKIPRGSNMERLLTSEERAEFRSVAGCLQWLSGQCRPELAAANSLANHGANTTLGDLRDLYQAVDFARETKDHRFIIPDVPVNKATVVLAYSDASWANAEQSRSQCGVLITLCSAAVLQKTVPAMVVDWKSSRSQRVCRSTLAAESCAADEACDRSAYVNMFLGELLYSVPAHRVGSRMHNISVTDAKSLYDVVVSDSPNLSDKRSLVNIRAIQEVVSAERFHWIPTSLMWADALTKQSLELQLSMHDWLQEPTATLKQ